MRIYRRRTDEIIQRFTGYYLLKVGMGQVFNTYYSSQESYKVHTLIITFLRGETEA